MANNFLYGKLFDQMHVCANRSLTDGASSGWSALFWTLILHVRPAVKSVIAYRAQTSDWPEGVK